MNNTETGGPAFPGLHPSRDCRFQEEGMTLRDYFAAKAMQAEYSLLERRDQFTDCAKGAYAIADAMLEARK